MHDRLVSRRIDALHQCFLVLCENRLRIFTQCIFTFAPHDRCHMISHVTRYIDQGRHILKHGLESGFGVELLLE